MSEYIKFFAGTVSRQLAEDIAANFGTHLAKYEIARFSDGEIQPNIMESVRGHDIFIIQSTIPPADNLMELLLTIDAVRRASAKTINVVMPYFGYARQDRKDKPRVSIASKLIANMLTSAGASRVMTMDLHAGQIQGFFDIPLDHLNATAVFIPYIQNLDLQDLVIAAPDVGGVGRARLYAKHLKAEMVLIDKHRVRANEVASMEVIGDVKGKNVVLVDDICDTANTLCKAAEILVERGAKTVRACTTHAILSGNAADRITQSVMQEILVTNTVPNIKPFEKLKMLNIAPVFAKAISNIIHHESISSLFID